MGLLRHSHKEHLFQFTEVDLALARKPMFTWQDHDGSVSRDAFPFEAGNGCWRTEAHKAQINLARLQRAELLRRGHVKEVQRDVRKGLPKGLQRLGEQLEVKIGQIRDVQLAGLASAETLHRQDALRC